jgi:hypothetical protein
MILFLLICAIVVGAIVHHSARHTSRWFGPACGAALFTCGLMAFGPHSPSHPTKPPALKQEAVDTSIPLLPTHIDPITLKGSKFARVRPTAEPRTAVPEAHSGLSETTKQRVWIQVSQDGIRKRLKDPDSAKFKGVFFSTFEGTPVVCGQVNSKNGFGGYTGYQHFVAAGEVIGFLQEDMALGEFGKTWNRMCARKS